METLFNAIDRTPIIDHHAHNLLLPHEVKGRQLMVITTEAGEGPLKDTPSSLSHMRAVKQLSEALGCASDWASVESAIVKKRKEPDEDWARRCFEGIETVLVDDGLDESTVYPWDWHNRLTRSECKRIVRVEKVAESILKRTLETTTQSGESREIDSMDVFETWETTFIATIKKCIRDPEVVGFKSVICYRTGLAIADFSSDNTRLKAAIDRMLSSGSVRLEDRVLSPYFVHLTAQLISEAKGARKPFQFHTGLGDNDITLSLASPSHMQPFIKTYPNVPIVLLHASYPFTKEAGYLASVYENVFFDIGEVFPMVSQDGQESLLRESLELCPSQKLCWSTDGHWFPETYLLAVIQVREAMKKVFSDNVARGSLKIPQAVQIVQDILFNTSNRLYNLGLTLKPLGPVQQHLSWKGAKIRNLDILRQFLEQNPSVKFLRLQWLDYVTTLRLRIIPIKLALDMFHKQKSIGITKAVLGLIHQDSMVPTFLPVDEYELIPCFEGLRLGEREGYATVQGEFHEKDGSEVVIDPRSALRRTVQRAKKHDISFLVGFELEVVFMTSSIVDGARVYGKDPVSHAHAWSNASAMRNPEIMDVIDEIMTKLERSQIDLQQLHPESAPGQYEFVTGPLPPLEAVDTLLATQEIIYSVAEKHSFKATFVPKPYPMACGTGAHVHMSISPEAKYPSFYAGILKHLPAIAAFTYSNGASYDRMQDSVWSGGRHVTWGTQNREAPLRKVEGSHWEMKCMDGLANKYLALAATLGAGLQGMLDNEPLTHKDCAADPALLDVEARQRLGIVQQLPKDFADALQRLDKDKVLRNILGEDLVNTYLTVKYAEMEKLDGMEPEKRRKFLVERY